MVSMYDRILIEDGDPEYYGPPPGMEDIFTEDKSTFRGWFRYTIYLPIYRIVRWKLNPAIYWRQGKWFIQRGKRGYADYDIWSFDVYLSRVMRDGLRELANKSIGWPGDESPWPKFEDWQAALINTADGLDHYVQGFNINETCSCCGKYCKAMECPIVKEAFEELMALWPGLWD